MLALVGLVGQEFAAKRALRAAVLARRAARSAAERAALAEVLAARVCALPEVASAPVVAAYAGTGTEVPTGPLLDALRARGATVLLPVLLDGDDLAWGRYDGTLVEGRRGLREPPARDASIGDADVVVVPGVAYDAALRRLGRGGGSYDRALAPVTAPVVAFATDDEVLAEVPVEPHDRPVDVVVTPTRVLRRD
ncbi:MAG TPA: 5-formyltetrahydrofolate cyclo-ligase [Mycobacteriales bacterium]|jgi:5-formyltetrahydrofolate cyclo-ligase